MELKVASVSLLVIFFVYGVVSNPTTPTPAGAQGSSTQSPSGSIISDDDIQKLSEDLFKVDANNAFKHITVNLQGQKKEDSTNDDAPEHLLSVKPEAYEIPTVKAVLALLQSFGQDAKTTESTITEESKDESNILDEFLKSEVLLQAMRFISSKGYFPNDLVEFRKVLKKTWNYPEYSKIISLHNWIYYAVQEQANNINYLGYIKQEKLGNNGAIVKLRSSLNNEVQPVTTILVGTSPELEMALYTVCFFTRPNDACPISLGGTKFVIGASLSSQFDILY